MPTRTVAKGRPQSPEVSATVEDRPLASGSGPSASTPSPPPEPRPTKRPKRAETRDCPICSEPIPLRLLGQHAELETQRVQAVVDQIGSFDVCVDPHAAAIDYESSSRRRSGIQKSRPASSVSSSDRLAKTIRSIQRRRKQRHIALRDVTRVDDEPTQRKGKGRAQNGEACPICLQMVQGDPDVVSAHVDACLAHVAFQESALLAESHQQPPAEDEMELDIEDEGVDNGPWEETMAEDGSSRLRLRPGRGDRSTRRLGFEIRDRTAADVDVDVDVDGEDEEIFGVAQFTEADIGGERGPEVAKGQSDVASNGEGLALAMEVEVALTQARQVGDTMAIVAALEAKVKLLQSGDAPTISALSCRICLDPYTEPTVSTGCWHACCRECWLRCLGSTKLCPICKRITAASDLRRVYL